MVNDYFLYADEDDVENPEIGFASKGFYEGAENLLEGLKILDRDSCDLSKEQAQTLVSRLNSE